MRNAILTAALLLQGCSDSGSGGAAAPLTTETASPAVEKTVEKKIPAMKSEAVAEVTPTPTPEVTSTVVSTSALKLTDVNCVDPDLSYVKSGVTMTMCDGTTGAGTLVVADLTNLAAGNVKFGVTINGVVGAYTGAAGPDLTNLVAGNVKSGVVISGVTGSYDNRPADCSGNAQIGCVSTTAYKSADLTNLSAGNILTGVTIAGVSGSVVAEAHVNCTSNGQVGCVSTSTYKAADLTNLSAANIKSGVSIAGTAGQFPSATYKLAGADSTADLTDATFDAKVKSATAFEWFDAEGARYTYQGDADLNLAANVKSGVTIFGQTGTFVGTEPDAWDLRKGVTVGSTTGKLKTSCRNGSRIASFDNPYPATNGTTGGNSNVNTWDTLDAYANTLFGPSFDVNSLWTADNLCSGTWSTLASPSEDAVFRRLEAEGVSTAPTWSGYEDRISNLWWAFNTNESTWSDAVNHCVILNINGVTGWRLPTQKELMEFYVHGASRLTGFGGGYDLFGFGATPEYIMWAATSKSSDLTRAWTIDLRTGEMIAASKTTPTTYGSLCVR